TTPSAPASTGSALPAARPKPHASATATAYVSAEAAQPSTQMIDAARNPPAKSSLQRPAKSAKASATPVTQAERRSPQPALRNTSGSGRNRPDPESGDTHAGAILLASCRLNSSSVSCDRSNPY